MSLFLYGLLLTLDRLGQKSCCDKAGGARIQDSHIGSLGRDGDPEIPGRDILSALW